MAVPVVGGSGGGCPTGMQGGGQVSGLVDMSVDERLGVSSVF